LRHCAELTAIRLCTETPTAGGQPFEKGDEKLLKLASEAQSMFSSYASEDDGFLSAKSAPVVVVFTRYDKLVQSKDIILQGKKVRVSEILQKSKDEAQQVLDQCVEQARNRLEMPMPRHVKVSSIFSFSLFFFFARH
jgi:hypothetical protein